MFRGNRNDGIAALRTFWKRNSFSIIAAILVFCVGWTAVSIPYLFNGPYEASEPVRPNSGTHQFYQAECEAAKSRNWVVVADFEKPKNHQRQGDEKNPIGPIAAVPDFCNMAAQYRSAEAAEASSKSASWANFWTIIGVALLFGTLGLTVWTLIATQEITKVTREIGEAQTRAYLSVCHIGWPEDIAKMLNEGAEKVLLRGQESGLIFSVHIKNSGQTPAYDVVAALRLSLEVGGKNSDVAASEHIQIGFIGGRSTYSFDFPFINVTKGLPDQDLFYKDVWVKIGVFIGHRDTFQGDGFRWGVDQMFAGRLNKAKFQSLTSKESLIEIPERKDNQNIV